MLWAVLAGLAMASEPANVVGGEDAAEGRWPDAAVVYDGSWQVCTGTLIHENLVLTAAHCIGGLDKVELGVADYTDVGETIDVIQEIAYPNGAWSSYDIGILVLEHPASTPPRTIARDCITANDLKDGAEVAIVGWGALNEQGTQYGSELQEAWTTINDHDCTDMSMGCIGSISPGGELIAGGDGIDSCYGDSGGPLYLAADDGEEYLVGVTSRGVYLAGPPCGMGGIYARPDAIIDWIEDQTGETLARPDCGKDDPDNSAPDPYAESVFVDAGDSVGVEVIANDPDVGDAHTFAVIVEPAMGMVTADGGGQFTYTADTNASGADTFVVVVTDDGTPSLSGEATVSVVVDGGNGGNGGNNGPDLPGLAGDTGGWVASFALGDEPGGCGCSSGASAAGAWSLLALAAFVRRRRAGSR